MFKKEKVINGVLHYRESFKDEFKPYTLEQLCVIKVELENEISDFHQKMFELNEEVIKKEAHPRALDGVEPYSFAAGARWALEEIKKDK